MKKLFFKYGDVVRASDLSCSPRTNCAALRQGHDVWHYHNFSSLYGNGFPVCGVLKFYFPISNLNTLNKDSLDKYLSAYRSVSWGAKSSFLHRVYTAIKQDISICISGNVDVFFHEYNNNVQVTEPLNLNRWFLTEHLHSKYLVVDNVCESDKLGSIIHTDPDSDIVRFDLSEYKATRLMSSSLQHPSIKSYDVRYADLFIAVDGNVNINLNSLLRYIVSFRYKKYLIEDLIEIVFSYLHKKFGEYTDNISVGTIYNRLGNISICLERYDKNPLFTPAFFNVRIVTNNILR